jgi:TrmH family RNA methyltransferase
MEILMSTPSLIITSTTNPKIKQAAALRNRRDRDATGLFLIEGYREISRALTGNVIFDQLFYCEELFLGSNENDLLFSCFKQGACLIKTSSHVFEKISYRDRPDGLLAVAKKMNLTIDTIEEKLPKNKNPLIVIAEAIEKPGNLGTIIRSSDAAGVDIVIVANGCTDIYNPNVVRASVGTLFTIPVIETSNEEALSFCKRHQINLLAATPEGKSVYTDVAMTEPLGIIVGTEQLGLSSFWKEACHERVRIPMAGIADSLNVAMATTLFLFEAVRQRHVN